MQVKELPEEYDYLAPDKSEIRKLLAMKGGGVCHCTLPEKGVSHAVMHKTVEEIWYFLSGRGELWRRLGDKEEIVAVTPGVCMSLPVGTHFQFRSSGHEPLAALGVTMPPWPGEGESYPVEGPWESTAEAGSD